MHDGKRPANNAGRVKQPFGEHSNPRSDIFIDRKTIQKK
ncbi:hypothetical protein AXX16_2178 [Serratia rubidaea]|nr:hypothetical protein AXX16_2178 [Serratia rubidaea]